MFGLTDRYLLAYQNGPARSADTGQGQGAPYQ